MNVFTKEQTAPLSEEAPLLFMDSLDAVWDAGPSQLSLLGLDYKYITTNIF